MKGAFTIKFSEKIKYIRAQKNLTQQQLGEKLNVSRKTISGWENNRSFPDYQLANHIEKIFNLSRGSLLDNDEKISLVSNESKLLQTKTIKFLLLLEIIFIIVGYLSLIKIYNNITNSLTLVLITLFLRNKLNANKLIVNFDRKYMVYIFIFNIIIGFIPLKNVVFSHMNLMYAIGATMGTIFISYFLSFSVFITYIGVKFLK